MREPGAHSSLSLFFYQRDHRPLVLNYVTLAAGEGGRLILVKLLLSTPMHPNSYFGLFYFSANVVMKLLFRKLRLLQRLSSLCLSAWVIVSRCSHRDQVGLEPAHSPLLVPQPIPYQSLSAYYLMHSWVRYLPGPFPYIAWSLIEMLLFMDGCWFLIAEGRQKQGTSYATMKLIAFLLYQLFLFRK